MGVLRGGRGDKGELSMAGAHGLREPALIDDFPAPDLDTSNQEPESLQVNAEAPSSGSNGVIVVIVIIIVVGSIIGVSVYACCKRSRPLKYHRYEMPGPGLSHGVPGSPHRTLPKVFHVLQQKVLKEPY